MGRKREWETSLSKLGNAWAVVPYVLGSCSRISFTLYRRCVKVCGLNAGVLDIAGGSGSLSFCLQTVHGVRCTTIDPRPAKLSKDAHRHLARIRAEAAGAAAGSFLFLLDSNAACESLWGCLEQDASSAANDLSCVRLSEGRYMSLTSTHLWYLPIHILILFAARGRAQMQTRCCCLWAGLHTARTRFRGPFQITLKLSSTRNCGMASMHPGCRQHLWLLGCTLIRHTTHPLSSAQVLRITLS